MFRRAMQEPGQLAPRFLPCRRLRPDERNGGVRGVGEITSVSAMDRLLSDISRRVGIHKRLMDCRIATRRPGGSNA
jgi:hypothetical protein